MPAIEVNQISKNFGALRAVDDVSFTVEAGEIFGLLGPNGAGKTTTIRIILDIYRPDSGSVSILGGPMSEKLKDLIGYLPEERGLYQEISLERCLVYLATLKGLTKRDANLRVSEYLERFDLAQARKKKVKELSKGMQQKAQLIATLIHQPQLVIIDEPFSALDPINTQMVKELLRNQREQGIAVVMCSHQMHQVEELCDRLVLINHGRSILYGSLDEIRRQFTGQEVLIHPLAPLPEDLPGVEAVEPVNGRVLLRLKANASPQDLLRELVNRGIPLEQFEIAIPTLDEIFIQVVREQGQPE